jgi:hypothetical protein
MYTRAEVRSFIDDIFEEEALIVGGLVVMQDVPDRLVWRVVRSLDQIHSRTVHRLRNQPSSGRQPRRPNLSPHPAIQSFLLRLRGK